MGIHYLIFGSYWRNLTSPLTCWYRGTAFHLDAMKNHREMQVLHTELGTGMVLLAMAARIMQAIFSLIRNRLPKRTWYWKMLPVAWMSRAFKAVLWMCLSVMDLLLAMEMTRVYFNKSHSKNKLLCHKENTMNSISIKYQWGYAAEPAKETVTLEEEELTSNHTMKMEKLQEDLQMDVDRAWPLSSNTDKMETTENFASICTNPIILSMICQPAEDGESLLPSEESEVEGLLEMDASLEDISMDSGLQESWTLKSQEEEESDWSDEDSWDEDSEADCNDEAEDLWASFCHNDDPYNPLSFAMPTSSLQKQSKQVKKQETTASHKQQEDSSSQDRGQCYDAFKVTCEPGEKQKSTTCKKPVLSSFKSSHKCYLKDELDTSQEIKEDENKSVKKVRFSSTVTVRPIIAWSYAHRMARKGPWEEYARDRCRFQRRIAEAEAAIGYCLNSRHRERIWAGFQQKQE